MRWGLLSLLVAYPMAVVLLATRSGIAVSQDSVSYLSTAASFADGHGLIAFDGQPLTLFPPALPILVGLMEMLGLSPLLGAAILNVVCVGAAVAGAYALGTVTLRHSGVALVAAGVVSLSASFTEVYVWLWTEPLFTALSLWLLVLLAWGTRTCTAPWWFVIISGLLATMAASVRYVGLVLVPVAALGVWWASRSLSKPGRLVRMSVAVAISLSAPAVLVLRNLAAGSGPLGERYPGVRTIPAAVSDAAGVLGEYLMPPSTLGWGVQVGTVLGILVAIALWLAFLRRDRVAGLVGIFIVLYAGANIWSQSATRLDSPSARLLAPVLPAVAVLAVSGGRDALVRMRRQVTRWAADSSSEAVKRRGGSAASAVIVGLVVVVLGVFAVGSVRASARLVETADSGALGLRAAAEASPLATAARTLPDAAGFASNDPWSMYLGIQGGRVLHLPPDPAEWPDERIARDRDRLVEAVRSGAVTHALVIDQGSVIDSWEPLEAAGVSVTLVEKTADGRVYRLLAGDES